jgi:cysteine desulfurase
MVQALGKIPIHLNAWDLDAASFAAHKLGGPRGIGLLYLKTPVDVLVAGGGHERGVRSGTENVAGAIALACCIEKYAKSQNLNAHYLAAAQRMNYLINELTQIPRCKIAPASRGENDNHYSPYIVQCSFDNIPGEVMQRTLDDAGFAVSTGSACRDASKKRGNLNIIRISQGYSTTNDDINALLDAIKNILHRM